MLGGLLSDVLSLARHYSKFTTAEMKNRKALVSRAASVLNGWLPELVVGTPLEVLTMTAEPGGQMGYVSPVAWFRICSKAHSPSTTSGYYLVYLFAANGSAVYLSLHHGTSKWSSGSWRPLPPQEVIDHTAVARANVHEFLESNVLRQTLWDIDLGAKKLVGDSRRRIRNYELANVVATRYDAGSIPDDGVLRADLESYLPLLAHLYEPLISLQTERNAQPAGVVEKAEKSTPSPKGQGPRLDTASRIAIESHAMDIAKRHYEKLGWVVEDVSRYKPFDLLCKKKGTEKHVEVKGTTTTGEQIILTPNEVEHARHYPQMSLALVTGIDLEDDAGKVTAGGGKLEVVDLWVPEDDLLVPTQYVYRVGKRA